MSSGPRSATGVWGWDARGQSVPASLPAYLNVAFRSMLTPAGSPRRGQRVVPSPAAGWVGGGGAAARFQK